jgi:glycosyltransferase involved in cell wall biosynthesis
MKQPLVSILIPCYNAAGSICECIQSALDQTYPEKEILVLDDGSTDDSRDRIRAIGNKIKWASQSNQGGNPARNTLLQQARGKWIQYLDADDILFPDKIVRQVDVLQNDPAIDMIYSPIIAERHSRGNMTREEHKIPESHDPWDLLASWRFPQTGGVLWRKEAVIDVGGWKESLECCQEHELYSRMMMAGKKLRFSSYAGAVYRIHSGGSVSSKDPLRVIMTRMRILDSVEEYLRKRGEMTERRRHLINLSRFESARIAWRFDRKCSVSIMKKVRKRYPSFMPSGPAAPPLYRVAYWSFGFKTAELIADIRRKTRA